jgi:putative ABC transport system permease protein
MALIGLILQNLRARLVRSVLTGLAVGIGVMTVVTLGVVTNSLRTTAGAVLRTGDADFTVTQKGASDVVNSVIDAAQVRRIDEMKGVDSAVGVLLAITKTEENPLFIEIGIDPEQLAPFGVTVVSGRPFAADATDEIMLGWRTADSLKKGVGDSITIDEVTYNIVGIYSVGNVFGDAASMLPRTHLQSAERKPNIVTLVFVKVLPGAHREAIRERIQHDIPVLTTVRLASEFGRADRSLQLISAADRGATILALVVGALFVTNTMLLSFFERTREFGLLRAVGWARWRIVLLVLGEVLVISILGAGLGVGLSFLVTQVLREIPDLIGILQPEYTAEIFGRALYVAVGIGFVGALYPALRAALMRPLAALRRE